MMKTKKTRTKRTKVALLKNILICGTPGTGKSTLAKLVLEKVNNNNNNKRICYEYVNVGDVCKAKNFYHSFDERLNSFVIDEDKILDHLEPLVRRGRDDFRLSLVGVFPGTIFLSRELF